MKKSRFTNIQIPEGNLGKSSHRVHTVNLLSMVECYSIMQFVCTQFASNSAHSSIYQK